MLLSYLIGTVFKLYGPVTDYWTYNANSHISYEYVITNSDECHIAVGITRNDDERSVSWDEFPVKDSLGGNVKSRRSTPESVSVGFVPSHTIFSAGDLRPGKSTKVAYLMQPDHSKFSFEAELRVESESGKIEFETTSVTCDVEICRCYPAQ